MDTYNGIILRFFEISNSFQYYLGWEKTIKMSNLDLSTELV